MVATRRHFTAVLTGLSVLVDFGVRTADFVRMRCPEARGGVCRRLQAPGGVRRRPEASGGVWRRPQASGGVYRRPEASGGVFGSAQCKPHPHPIQAEESQVSQGSTLRFWVWVGFTSQPFRARVRGVQRQRRWTTPPTTLEIEKYEKAVATWEALIEVSTFLSLFVGFGIRARDFLWMR